jgi:hypothetical protein
MKLWQKILLAAILTVISGAGALGWWVISSLEELCGNAPISETPSPNGKMKVVVFQRDCGATTGFSTQVSILPIAQSLPKESGNVFTSDTDHGKAPSGPKGGPEVRIQWRGDKVVSVAHHKAARVFHERSKIRDITVTYSQFD